MSKIQERLVIKNIGPISDIDVEIKPFTVFVGDSACGKSTVMKVLILMRYIFKKVNIRAYFKNSGVDKAPFYIRFQDLLRDNLKAFFGKESYIFYEVKVNGHSYYIKYEGSLDYSASIANEDLVFFKESWVSEMRSVIPMWTSLGSFVNKMSLGFYFDETLTDSKLAFNSIRHLDLDYVGLSLDVVNAGGNQKKVVLTPKDAAYKPFELKHASSGIQTTVPLMMITAYLSIAFSYKDALDRSVLKYFFEKNMMKNFNSAIELVEMPLYIHMHIEEPELSLDPDAQRRFIDNLITMAFYNKKEDRTLGITCATHSPYILNHLNVLLRRKEGAHVKPSNIQVYNIYNGKAQNLVMTDDETGETVIDTQDLSETMAEIFSEYKSLGYEAPIGQ